MTCPCSFYKNDPEAHDLMVGFETMAPADASVLISELIIDETMSLLQDYTDDFVRFVAEHNHWSDPVAMTAMARYAEDVARRAHDGRRARLGMAV